MKELYMQFFQNVNNIDTILINKLHDSKFSYNNEKTEWYRHNLPGEKVFVLAMREYKYSPLLFFCSYKPLIYKLVNISFSQNFNDEEYDNEFNNIITIFNEEIKRNKYFKATTVDNASDISKIITSKICRDEILSLLQTFPNSYHPFDIKRMDKIIWSIHKYSRKTIDLNDLQEYLYKDKRLREEYIDFLINRIRSGLQLLYLYSNKYIY